MRDRHGQGDRDAVQAGGDVSAGVPGRSGADVAEARAWTDFRGQAHAFYTHADAQRWAKAHPFLGIDQAWHTGWAEVLGTGEVAPRREELAPVTKPQRPHDARRTERCHVPPEEAFEILEKRGLA
jgi:hypothetical protein